MKKFILKCVVLAGVVVTLLSFDLPTGWVISGSKPNSYVMYVDKGAGPDGKNVATIKSKDAKIDGFGSLMQQSKPDRYLGKRVRMVGYVKTANVTDWAGLVFRADQADSLKPLAFEDMHETPIFGTKDWKKYEIILDIPQNATLISYGALLTGTGQIWFDHISFEPVEVSVPSTKTINIKRTGIQDEPSNLDFEYFYEVKDSTAVKGHK